MNLELIKTQLLNKSFIKSNNFTNNFYKDLNLNQVKIINVLLFIFASYKNYYKYDSENLNNIFQIMKQEGSYEIEYKRLLEFLNSQYDNKQYNLINLKKELEDIRKKSCRYVKIDQEKGIKRERYTSLITNFEIITKEEEREITRTRIKISIDKELYTDIFEYNTLRGYNIYNIKLTKLHSKLGICLYELLNKFLNTKYIKNDTTIKNKNLFRKYYKLSEINDILNVEYKYLSQILIDIEKQYLKIQNLNILDLEDRQFKFEIENKMLKIDLINDKFSKRDIEDSINF